MRKILVFSVLGLSMLAVAGCSTDNNTDDLHSIYEEYDESVDDEDETKYTGSFSADDIMTFMFEGTEYTIPLEYEEVENLGWTVSPDMELIREDGSEYFVLLMDNSNYPDVSMILSFKTVPSGIYDNETFIAKLKQDGIWDFGIDVYEADTLSDSETCPEFEVKGVSLGDSSDDIFSAFGKDYDTNFSFPEDGSYLYNITEKDGDTSVVYTISFSLTDDQICGMEITVLYL